MSKRSVLLAVASAVTTVLAVGAVVIELLSGLYGESPGVGMLGVFGGLVAGLLVGAAVVLVAGRLTGVAETALVAYGAFGVAFLAVAALRYVNAPGADAVFTFPVQLAVSLLFALIAAALESRMQTENSKSGV